MTPCKIVCYAYNAGGSVSYHGVSETRSRCDTHDFDLTNYGLMSQNYKCPIGRIEEATEKAIKEIESCSTRLKAK